MSSATVVKPRLQSPRSSTKTSVKPSHKQSKLVLSNAAVHRTLDTLSKALDVEGHGGTIFQRDDRTIVLADYDPIDTVVMERVVKLFPNMTYSIHSSSSSATGFMVIFTVLDFTQLAALGSQVWFQSCITMCSCLCSLVFVTLYPLWQTSQA